MRIEWKVLPRLLRQHVWMNFRKIHLNDMIEENYDIHRKGEQYEHRQIPEPII